MSLPIATVEQAIYEMDEAQYYGIAQTSTDPKLHYSQAIQAVNNNITDFRMAASAQLQNWPLTQKFFGSLIAYRLQQDDPLASRFVRTLFGRGPESLEERLHRIQGIANIAQVSAEVGLPKNPGSGAETDDLMLDAWAEFLVADVLLKSPDVQCVEKIIRPKNRPTVEFFVNSNNEEWMCEVARLRRREDFKGTTYSMNSPECEEPENVQNIRFAIANKLKDKNDQIARFTQQENRTYARQIVAIKTSQDAYQDCLHVVERETKGLLRTGNYPSITHVLLVPDTGQAKFVDCI